MIFYDSLEVYTFMTQRTRLFGNTNVGYHDKCNLEIGGQLAYDEAFHLQTVRILPTFQNEKQCQQVLQGGILNFYIGDMPVFNTMLFGHTAVPLRVPYVIPVRQHISADVTLVREEFEKMPTQQRERLYVCLYGWRVRR